MGTRHDGEMLWLDNTTFQDPNPSSSFVSHFERPQSQQLDAFILAPLNFTGNETADPPAAKPPALLLSTWAAISRRISLPGIALVIFPGCRWPRPLSAAGST